jgi:hypothetical protein
MEWIAVLKIGMILGGLGLLFFSLRWLYLKLKEVNYRRGYDAAEKQYQEKVVNAYNDIASGREPFSVQHKDTKWGEVSDSSTGVRLESDKGNGVK